MKKNLKKLAALLLAVLLAGHVFTAAAAIVFEMSEETGGGDVELRAALSIENEYGPYLLVGNSLTLSVPAGYTDVKWSSADTNIATVSDGVVTGVSAGRVKITARDNSSSEEQLASTFVTVVDPEHTYTVTYEIDYPGDAYMQLTSEDRSYMNDTTLTDKTDPLTGDSVDYYLNSGDYDTTNYKMVGWVKKGESEVLTGGTRVTVTGDVTYQAKFEKTAADAEDVSLNVHYLGTVDGVTYYENGRKYNDSPVDGAVWKDFTSKGTVVTKEDGNPYVTFAVVNAQKTVVNGQGYAKTGSESSGRSFIGLKLLAISTGRGYLDIGAYSGTVFEPGEVVELPYGGRTDGYFFEGVFEEGQAADAEVRVVVGYVDRNSAGDTYYIGRSKLTEEGVEAVLAAEWGQKSELRTNDGNERHIYGEDEEGNASYYKAVNPDYFEMTKAMKTENVLKKLGMTGLNPDDYEVIWSKLAQTESGFVIEGALREKEEKTEKTDMVILINGDEIRKTYDGKPSEITFAASSSAEGFDESKVLFDGPTYTRTDCGTTMSKWTAKNFAYEDENVNATFVVNNGWLRITPATAVVTVEAADKLWGQDDPEFTATVTGLVNEDDEITYEIKREEGEEEGTYEVYATGKQPKDSNYKVQFVDATMNVEMPPVTIESSAGDAKALLAGTEITLTAVMEGLNTDDYNIQWQMADVDDPDQMVDIEGANGITYTYNLSEETAGKFFRVVVTLK